MSGGTAGVSWWTSGGDAMAHGFADGRWMRSLCGDLRWNAALADGTGRYRCTGCEALARGVQVTPVAKRPVDRDARRRAIARARGRRWSATS